MYLIAKLDMDDNNRAKHPPPRPKNSRLRNLEPDTPQKKKDKESKRLKIGTRSTSPTPQRASTREMASTQYKSGQAKAKTIAKADLGRTGRVANLQALRHGVEATQSAAGSDAEPDLSQDSIETLGWSMNASPPVPSDTAGVDSEAAAVDSSDDDGYDDSRPALFVDKVTRKKGWG